MAFRSCFLTGIRVLPELRGSSHRAMQNPFDIQDQFLTIVLVARSALIVAVKGDAENLPTTNEIEGFLFYLRKERAVSR